jgi:hypothetical protein
MNGARVSLASGGAFEWCRGVRRLVATAPPRVRYQPYYCEENIWHLAQDAAVEGRRREVVFISNEQRRCAVWHQRAAVRAHWPILWDYHVVLLCQDPWQVWDLDTTLDVPCRALDYLQRSFRPGVGRDLEPLFRVVDADLFVSELASDRSHMRGARGEFLRPPPPWPAIGAPSAPPNLERFIDMRRPFLGEVLDMKRLVAHIADA